MSGPGLNAPGLNAPVSVVVPVRNGARTLAACLAAIGAQDYPGEREVIVVDNGSTDATPAIIARFGFARRIACATPGPAAARNAGIAAARHPIIAFTDADCEPAAGWLSALVARWEPALAGIGGRLDSARRGPVEDVVAAISFDQRQAIESALPYVITANCLFRREALRAIGGFDEAFPIAGGEDTDLGWRLVAAGERIAYAPDALCLHNHPARLLDLLSQRVRYGYAMRLLWAKYRASPLGPALAAILPNWTGLCLSLTQPPPPGREGRRGLHACADIAYVSGWFLAGGRGRGAGGDAPARPARPRRERLRIAAATPLVALACAGVLGAMVVSGRHRRVFRRPAPRKAAP
jgi:GT2 family glycosyltransferase